jgi:hypothetical protein
LSFAYKAPRTSLQKRKKEKMSSPLRNTFATLAATLIVISNAVNFFGEEPNASTVGLRSGLVEAYEKAETEGRENRPIYFTARQNSILTPDVQGTAEAYASVVPDCRVFDVQAYNDVNLLNIASGTRTQQFRMTVCDFAR